MLITASITLSHLLFPAILKHPTLNYGQLNHVACMAACVCSDIRALGEHNLLVGAYTEGKNGVILT